MRTPWAVEFQWLEAHNRRSPARSQAMGGAPRCGDLCPSGFAAQVANEGAAYADGLLLVEGSSEDVAPIAWASPSNGYGLRVRLWQSTHDARNRAGPYCRHPGWSRLVIIEQYWAGDGHPPNCQPCACMRAKTTPAIVSSPTTTAAAIRTQ
jgi:hypothetical protein